MAYLAGFQRIIYKKTWKVKHKNVYGMYIAKLLN
jgi:hypothetical protein